MGKLVLTTVAGASIELGLIPFDLYAKGPDSRMVLFCRSGFSISPRHKIILHRIDRIFYICSDDIDAYLEYSFERIEQIVASSDVKVGEKARIVRGVGKMVMRRLMEEPRSGELVDKSRRFIDSQIDLVLNSPEAKPYLFALSATDPHFLSHSINVSTFCVLLGEQLYGDTREELRQLGIGGLLHDIGKIQIDKELILKPTPLTGKEIEEMHRHPQLSYELMSSFNLSKATLAIGLNHHERADGSGFPESLRGDNIHPFARIAAVANVYDNMTSKRFDHSTLTHIQALSAMAERGGRFDRGVFEALLRIVLHDDRLVRGFMKKRVVLQSTSFKRTTRQPEQDAW